MLHRIVGAILLMFIGVLIAVKFQKFSEENPPTAPVSYDYLKPLSLDTIQKEVREGDHKITLINLWASWCVPCLKEFPELIKMREKYGKQGLKLILISTDDEANKPAAQKILTDHKVDFNSYYKGDQSFEILDQIYPNWNGALPASLIVTKEGQVVEAWFGETTGAQFEERIKKHL